MLKKDSPNLFSTAFLTDTGFVESSSRRLIVVDKSPELFLFILDHLRGYTIFPLQEAAIPPRWLPIQKLYDNLRRDASYYGLLTLEAECARWLKRENNQYYRQSVLKLDFAPFGSNITMEDDTKQHPLCCDMIFYCHLADVQFLRKRYIHAGQKTLTYGPVPWKHVFEQVRSGSIADEIIQIDGTSMIESLPVFLKPFKSADDEIDSRKSENAKIHISKAVTTYILDGIRPAGMNNYLTLRFYVTDSTISLNFNPSRLTTTEDIPSIGSADFIFNDKPQKDGYATLHSIAAQQSEAEYTANTKWPIPIDKESKTVLEVDTVPLDWSLLCQWAKISDSTTTSVPFSRDLAIYERLFGPTKSDTKGPKVSPPRETWD
jgi:hypothetical protein